MPERVFYRIQRSRNLKLWSTVAESYFNVSEEIIEETSWRSMVPEQEDAHLTYPFYRLVLTYE